jgi:hypothetical protein
MPLDGDGSGGLWMLILTSGHLTELKETLGAGLPVLFAAAAVAVLLLVLSVLPSSTLPLGAVGDFFVQRRRHVALVGAAIWVCAATTLFIVFWVL